MTLCQILSVLKGLDKFMLIYSIYPHALIYTRGPSQLQFWLETYPRMNKSMKYWISIHQLAINDNNIFLFISRLVSFVLLLTLFLLQRVMIPLDNIRTRPIPTRRYYRSHYRYPPQKKRSKTKHAIIFEWLIDWF